MLYAAYGSNLHPARLQRRAPSARLLGGAAVPGRTLRFHKRSVDGSGKCDIVEVGAATEAPTDATVHVAVYDLPERERGALDRAESLGTGYRLAHLPVNGFGECFTYVAMDAHIDPQLRPYGWYRELVLVGCRHLGFPDAYVARIAATETVQDTNPDRVARHMEIVRTALATNVHPGRP